MRRLLPIIVILALGTSACSFSLRSEPNSSATATATESRTTTATPTQTPTDTAPALDASTLFINLSAEVPEISLTITYDADTDPNDLLGRPGQYTSKIAFADNRVAPDDVVGEDPGSVQYGGSIEVFATQAQAQARADYIQGLVQAAPLLGAEYDYVQGGALLRISGKLHPEIGADYEQAWIAATAP